MKLCTVCGVVTSRAGSRCTDHARQSNRSRHNALYLSRLRHIGMGRAHAGEEVRLLIAVAHVRVVATDGSLLRELVLDAERDYQPRLHPSTMS